MKSAKFKEPFYILVTLMIFAFLWKSPLPSLFKYAGSVITMLGGMGGYWHKVIAENKKDQQDRVTLNADLLTVRVVVVGALLSMMSVHSEDLEASKKDKETRQLKQEVILNVSLACHQWKNIYMALYPGHFVQVNDSHKDIWGLLENTDALTYSPDSWKYYRPLFVECTDDLVDQLDQLSSEYQDIMPVSLRSKVLSAKLQLQSEKSVYVQLPQLISSLSVKDQPNANLLFAMRFKETVRAIAEVDRETVRLK